MAAARVSTAGEGSRDSLDTDIDRDNGLIKYLMRERHGSPFEHNSFTYFVQAPIFVFREFQRHRIASYNEESGRYKELEPVFYVPDESRALQQTGRPGHYEYVAGSHAQYEQTVAALKNTADYAFANYKALLDAGIAREVARMCLPLNIYSSMYVTMNARALMNFLSLRTTYPSAIFPSHPQREIAMCADAMETLFAREMPTTHRAFANSGRVAP